VCRQTGGYGIGIAAEFVQQLRKINSIQYRILLKIEEMDWVVGLFEPTTTSATAFLG
jgi:hypothetical protein